MIIFSVNKDEITEKIFYDELAIKIARVIRRHGIKALAFILVSIFDEDVNTLLGC